jgi:hypothetical protein
MRFYCKYFLFRSLYYHWKCNIYHFCSILPNSVLPMLSLHELSHLKVCIFYHKIIILTDILWGRCFLLFCCFNFWIGSDGLLKLLAVVQLKVAYMQVSSCHRPNNTMHFINQVVKVNWKVRSILAMLVHHF